MIRLLSLLSLSVHVIALSSKPSPSLLAALEVPTVLRALAKHSQTIPGAALCGVGSLAGSAAAAREQYKLVSEAMALKATSMPPLRHPLMKRYFGSANGTAKKTDEDVQRNGQKLPLPMETQVL